MKIERILIAILAIAVVVLAGVLIRQREKPIDIEAERAAIRNADNAYSNAALAKDVERALTYFADDALLIPPSEPVVMGKEAIRKWASAIVATPGFAVSWQTTQADVSRSGDLGYTLASYELTVHDPKGNPVRDRGQDFHVWKKQPDGAWKVVIDIWNSDQPPPASAPAPKR